MSPHKRCAINIRRFWLTTERFPGSKSARGRDFNHRLLLSASAGKVKTRTLFFYIVIPAAAGNTQCPGIFTNHSGTVAHTHTSRLQTFPSSYDQVITAGNETSANSKERTMEKLRVKRTCTVQTKLHIREKKKKKRNGDVYSSGDVLFETLAFKKLQNVA